MKQIPYKRYILTVKKYKRQCSYEVIAYKDMHNNWRTSRDHNIISNNNVLLWREIENV